MFNLMTYVYQQTLAANKAIIPAKVQPATTTIFSNYLKMIYLLITELIELT